MWHCTFVPVCNSHSAVQHLSITLARGTCGISVVLQMHQTPCRKAFVRDVAAYLIASAVTLALLWDGAFARYEAVVQILLYMLYLSICVYTSRCAFSPTRVRFVA